MNKNNDDFSLIIQNIITKMPIGQLIINHYKYYENPPNYKYGCLDEKLSDILLNHLADNAMDLVWQTEEQPAQPHKCICPAINFSFNGIGCKCGGI